MSSASSETTRRGESAFSDFAFVALGSNLGNSRVLIPTVMDALGGLSDQPLLRSSLWLSEPVDCPPGSRAFINAAVALIPRPAETPESLLLRLQALEAAFGRRPKKIMNEPRELDLDLIAFRHLTRSTANLTLPHPRAHLRAFVLAPLSELAPDLVLAGQTTTVQQLLESMRDRLDGSEVRRVD